MPHGRLPKPNRDLVPIASILESILADERITAKTVAQVLPHIKSGRLCDADFRYFLGVLESTPLGHYAPGICDELFRLVKENLRVHEKPEEVIALGCAIRKLIFNLDDGELDRSVKLLDDLAKNRRQGQSTSIEKMICKALASRFESYPLLYSETVSKGIADRLALTIEELFAGNPCNDETTDATLGQAILGYLCYADKQDPYREKLKERLQCTDVPDSFIYYYRNSTISFQENIDRNWGDGSLDDKPDIKSFFENLWMLRQNIT